MAEEYDIFISYRRFEDEARQKENISKARSLSETFARRGFKVFFDQNERTAKALKEKILPAVRNSRCFVLLLTEKCLERCKNEGDWMRQEIEEAQKAGRTIVPVTLDSAVERWPNDLPESLLFLSDNGGKDITNIHNDTSYTSDIDALINDIIGSPRERAKGAEVHIETDYDCHVLRFKEELMLARKEEDNVLYLRKGKHKLVFEAEGCRDVKQTEVVEIPEIDYSTFVEVNLEKEVLACMDQKERERQEKERKEREERERKERERQEKERKDREESERKERESRGEFEVNGVKFKMIYVEGGTFMMGATEEQGNEAYEDEKPVHEVTLSDYYIGETVVTQELWKAVMGENPSYFKGDNLPVESVSWNDAQEFIAKLNKETGRVFCLPTEAQWEYAARGGKMSKKYKYSGSDIINEVAWYAGEEGGGGKTHPVKGKKANELGLYDMSGNVYELCNDWHNDLNGNYSSDAQTDPQGPEEGYKHVRRGGDWSVGARLCRVSYHDFITPSERDFRMGFRLVMCP